MVNSNIEKWKLDAAHAAIENDRWWDRQGFKPPNDFAPTVEYIISSALTEREYKILKRRFDNEPGTKAPSFLTIGHEFGISGSRVEQIIYKIFRKIRCHKYFKLGIAEYERHVRASYEKKEADKLEAERELRKKFIARNNGNNDIELKLSDDDDIEMLGLSVRAFNCLHRKGVKTIEELLATIENGSIFRIRNAGISTIREIFGALAERGINIYQRYPDYADPDFFKKYKNY